MARRGAWRPRRRKASPTAAEGDAADGGPRDRGPPPPRGTRVPLATPPPSRPRLSCSNAAPTPLPAPRCRSIPGADPSVAPRSPVQTSPPLRRWRRAAAPSQLEIHLRRRDDAVRRPRRLQRRRSVAAKEGAVPPPPLEVGAADPRPLSGPAAAPGMLKVGTPRSRRPRPPGGSSAARSRHPRCSSHSTMPLPDLRFKDVRWTAMPSMGAIGTSRCGAG